MKTVTRTGLQTEVCKHVNSDEQMNKKYAKGWLVDRCLTTLSAQTGYIDRSPLTKAAYKNV